MPTLAAKSTLLRALARLLKPRVGAVHLDGQGIHRLLTKEVARRLGILPQQPITPEGLTVADLVARGRAPHQGWLTQWSNANEAVVAALEATGTLDLAARPVDDLSGGQRQRAWITMALAQGTPLMLLDEPTTFLDLAHQVDGAVVARRRPGDVVTAELVEDVFGLAVRVIPDPESGTPLVIPRARAVPHPLDTSPTAAGNGRRPPACWRKHDQSHPGTNRRKAACQRPHRRAPRHHPGAHGDGVRR